jgi:uncharacterized protein (TIGR03790 family)
MLLQSRHSPFGAVGLLLAGLAVSAQTALALGPHEILLLVNENSPRSLHIANVYADLRGVPDENIVYLRLPDKVLEPAAEISQKEFMTFIWEPATQAIQERGLSRRILAWVYSAGFPVRITTQPTTSIQGMTFVRGQMPAAEQVQKGLYLSPFFAGPDRPGGGTAGAHGLRWFKDMMQEQMPVPSMMLAYMGARGNELKAVMDCLSNGVAADRTWPTGAVYFVVNDDIRSKCRAWQYPEAQTELQALLVPSVITSNIPITQKGILGVMAGSPWLSGASGPFYDLNAYAPGCVADHLTSSGAIFDQYDQSKVSLWIHGGITATEGTVTEPLAIWTKFMNARFFVHYALGCSILESFFQSIRCPLQILLLGEPLATPRARPIALQLTSASDETATEFEASAQVAGATNEVLEYTFLLDGKTLEDRVSRTRITVGTEKLTDGYHVLRCIASTPGLVEYQAFAVTNFTLNARHRRVTLEGVLDGACVGLGKPLTLSARTTVEPDRITLLDRGRPLIEQSGKAATFQIEPGVLGPGPHALRASIRYEDGVVVLSPPVRCVVCPTGSPPVIGEPQEVKQEDGWTSLKLPVSDPDNDRFATRWLQPLTFFDSRGRLLPCAELSGGSVAVSNGVMLFAGRLPADVLVFKESIRDTVKELRVTLALDPVHSAFLKDQVAGIAFNFQNRKNFSFFALFGDTSSWTLGRFENGTLVRAVTRGAFIRGEAWHALSVKQDDRGVTGFVNGEELCRWPDGRLTGRFGLVAATAEPVHFQDFAASPPVFPTGAFRIAPGESSLLFKSDAIRSTTNVLLEAFDGAFSTRKAVVLSR